MAEDVGEADHTSQACIPADAVNRAQLLIKSEGIIAGVNMAERIALKVDPGLVFTAHLKDGAPMKPGDIALELSGNSRAILKAERLLLNCMQRMSGIATYTRHLHQLIAGTRARLLDTRKTTPGFRLAEKWAVMIGGGTNHRFNLSDMILIKDNHIAFAGGVRQAITATQAYLEKNNLQIPVEIEARTLEEVKEVIEAGGIDRILLDNMDTETLRTAVGIINQQYETEASGGITESTIRSVAETGVGFISVGALTHSAKSLDMSLEAC